MKKLMFLSAVFFTISLCAMEGQDEKKESSGLPSDRMAIEHSERKKHFDHIFGDPASCKLPDFLLRKPLSIMTHFKYEHDDLQIKLKRRQLPQSSSARHYKVYHSKRPRHLLNAHNQKPELSLEARESIKKTTKRLDKVLQEIIERNAKSKEK